MPGLHALHEEQERLVRSWLSEPEVVADHSWGLVDTVVLEVCDGDRRVIVKAGGPDNHHLRREITARRRWTGPWLETGTVGALLHASAEHAVLVIEHLPGVLVQDLPAVARDPQTHRQAGDLLARLHRQAAVVDEEYEATADAKALWWLDQQHRIAPAVEEELRAAVASHDHAPVVLVPTHGDWHTRNWLHHAGRVSVIDLGRAALRPAVTDLARLAAREWQGHPELETAFVDGYGTDPRTPDAWRATLLREAIGTAVWAHRVGDERFEQQGHRMIARALELYA